DHSAPIVGRVELRSGGKAWTLGEFDDPPRSSGYLDLTDWKSWNEERPTDLDPGAVFDLAIIPEVDRAEHETCYNEVWGREIIIHNVTIRPRYPSRDSAERN